MEKSSDIINFSDTQLIKFLRELAHSIESKKIHSDKLQRCGEFFMSEKFQDEVLQQNGPTEVNKEIDDFDVIKFITLGWYMYRVISNTNNPTGSTEHYHNTSCSSI